MRYQTGDVRALRPDDPFHAERHLAERDVMTRSARDPDGFFGVWRSPEDGSELLAIAHGGTLFRA